MSLHLLRKQRAAAIALLFGDVLVMILAAAVCIPTPDSNMGLQQLLCVGLQQLLCVGKKGQGIPYGA